MMHESDKLICIVGPVWAETLMRGIAALLADADRPVMVFATGSGDMLTIPELAQATLLVCLMIPCGSREMDAMPALRGIVSPILGYDWIDVEEATRRAIPVVNGEVPENRESMAEATIMLVLASLYRLRETEAELRGGAESVQHRRMLKGRTVGIIGYGGITRQIIHRLENWQANVLVYTREVPDHAQGVSFVSRDQLLAASDVVLLMTRLDAENRHLIDRSRLQEMKRGVLLVNTARGGLIDEGALVQALESGHVGAAALDVFEVEPLPLDHPFRRFSNVILTPHSVGRTDETLESIPRMAAANVLQLLAGQLPASCKNRSVEDVWNTAAFHVAHGQRLLEGDKTHV